MNSAAIGDRIKSGLGARRMLASQLQEAQETAAAARAEADTLTEVVALLAALQESWKLQFQEAVGRIVSKGLAGVFGEELELVVEMGQRGDLPTTQFSVRDGRGLVTEIVDARGGGLVNVTSFLLRVLLLLSARPKMSRLLVLDETFSNVSAEYVPTLTALLRRVVDEGGFQILLVTHRPELADVADVAYRFRLVDGETVVELVKSPADDVAEAGIA